MTADGARTYEQTGWKTSPTLSRLSRKATFLVEDQTIDAAETALLIVHPSLEAIAADKDKSLEVAMKLAS